MRLSEELTKALINGYYLKDFDGWETDAEYDGRGRCSGEHSILHLGYGVTIECYTPGDDCTVCLVQKCEGGGYVRLAIECCDIAVDDEKVVISSIDKDCRIEILHDPLPYGYAEKHCTKRLREWETEKCGGVRGAFVSEYVGLPEYEERLAPMSDETLDMLVRFFEFGEKDAVPWETDGIFAECTMELVKGHFLGMSGSAPAKRSAEPKARQTTLFPVADNKKEERNDMYAVAWSSPDGTHRLYAETRYVDLSEGELQIGCRRSEICYGIGDRLKERLKRTEQKSVGKA